jgi:uncharacterized membrane protein
VGVAVSRDECIGRAVAKCRGRIAPLSRTPSDAATIRRNVSTCVRVRAPATSTTTHTQHRTQHADTLTFSLMAAISIGSLNLSLLINTVGFYQIAKVWKCGSVAQPQCGSVEVWLNLRKCGSTSVWKCGSVAQPHEHAHQHGRLLPDREGVEVWKCGSTPRR